MPPYIIHSGSNFRCIIFVTGIFCDIEYKEYDILFFDHILIVFFNVSFTSSNISSGINLYFSIAMLESERFVIIN